MKKAGAVRLTNVVLIVAMLAASAVGAQPDQLADSTPGQVFLTPQVDLNLAPVLLEVPERYALAGLTDRQLMVPPGFAVNVFAAGEPLEGPRFMAFDPRNVLHVANMKAGGGSEFTPPVNSALPPAVEQMRGQVLALPDDDGDGVADEIRVVADQFWFPNSIQFFAGYLYVADMHQVVRLRDVDGDGRYEEREVVVPDLPIGHHRTRSIEFDRQRKKLYLSIGSSCDLCRESDPRRATIMEFDPDGSNGRIYASGLRNAVGLGIHPTSNELWITTNGHDREGRHLPPEMVTVVRDGGFYGWPLAFGFRSWVDFSIGAYQNEIFPLTAQDTSDVERVPRPVAMLPAHLAPMDVHFYRGKRFPDPYRDAAFVAFRGGGNAAVMGHKVVALFADADGQNARVGDFLTGFQPRISSGSGVWGEPTGLATDEQGHLYISSDWSNHMILRVVASPLRGFWRGLPDAVVAGFTGSQVELDEIIRVEGLDPEGAEAEVVADLSVFGGPANLALEALGEGEFRLRQRLDLGSAPGVKTLTVRIAQRVSGERFETRVRRVFEILPGRDWVIIGEAIDPGWQLNGDATLQPVGFAEAPSVFRGLAAAFVAADVSFRGWNIALDPLVLFDPFGYRSLRFALHPGDTGATTNPRLVLNVKPGRNFDVIAEGGIDLQRSEWQEVTIPVAALELSGPVEQIRFQGNLEGRFFIDELRLETATPQPDMTAIFEDGSAQPNGLLLAQNYPNPFNAETVIGYRLDREVAVALSVYNLVGQRVKHLMQGAQNQGVYQCAWDGRDDRGREMASGVYVYRLWAGGRVEVRKMLLAR